MIDLGKNKLENKIENKLETELAEISKSEI
jgi:hypothetical protein